MKSRNNKVILILLSFFISANSFAQTELSLNRVEGFSSSDKIADLMFEDNGKLWIASKAGVFSYSPSSKSTNKKLM